MTDEKRQPKHAFNGKLVFEGIVFFAALTIGIVFYILAWHPFGWWAD